MNRDPPLCDILLVPSPSTPIPAHPRTKITTRPPTHPILNILVLPNWHVIY